MTDGWLGVQERNPASYGYEAKHPWRFQCPKPNCFMSVCADNETAALEIQQNHTCPHWGGQTKVGWSVTKTLVQQMWDLIDETMPEVMTGASDAKIRARAIAECLAIFMVPFFSTADEIAHEALKRYKAKQAGEEYESPGMNARRYDRPGLESKDGGFYRAPDGGFTSDKGQAGFPANKKRGGSIQTAVKPETHKLTEKEIEAIRYMHGSGVFPIAQLAKTYGVSEAIIQSVLT